MVAAPSTTGALMARSTRLMASANLARRSAAVASTSTPRARALHSSAPNSAITSFAMPAMSPTMTEGGLATWKVKEGDSFAAGDVLLEIETDKATMDVEAQDDGIMAKILVQEGAKAVPVGKVIAMLAEEGDDISNVEAPKEDAPAAAAPAKEPKKEEKKEGAPKASSSAPAASPPKAQGGSAADQAPQSSSSSSGETPMFPSVARLLHENHISSSDARSIKPTGVRGMLTKGDVLAHLGKAESPTGTLKEETAGIARYVADAIKNWSKEGGGAGGSGAGAKSQAGEAAKSKSKEATEPLTADSLRSLIISGLASSSPTARLANVASTTYNPNPPPSSYPTSSKAGPRRSTTPNDVLGELVGEYNFGKRRGLLPKKSLGKSTKGKGSFAGLL